MGGEWLLELLANFYKAERKGLPTQDLDPRAQGKPWESRCQENTEARGISGFLAA